MYLSVRENGSAPSRAMEYAMRVVAVMDAAPENMTDTTSSARSASAPATLPMAR